MTLPRHPKRALLLGLFVLLMASDRASVRGDQPPADTDDLRKQVVDWLNAANASEFSGKIQFTKRMRLPADPSQKQGVEHARAEIARCERQHARQMEGLKGVEGATIDALRETVTKSHKRSIAQYEEMIQHFEAWSTTGIEVEQHWSVIYVSPDSLRVEVWTENVDPPATALYPAKHIQATSGGQAWSQMSSLMPGVNNDPAGHPVDDPEFVKLAREEMSYLLNPVASGLSADGLTGVERAADEIAATFQHGPDDDAPKQGMTVLTFERVDDGLRLRRSESTTVAHHSISTYDDYRDVGGRSVAFLSSVQVEPIAPARAPSESGERTTTYRIVNLETGVTQADIDLLVQPTAELPPHRGN